MGDPPGAGEPWKPLEMPAVAQPDHDGARSSRSTASIAARKRPAQIERLIAPIWKAAGSRDAGAVPFGPDGLHGARFEGVAGRSDDPHHALRGVRVRPAIR